MNLTLVIKYIFFTFFNYCNMYKWNTFTKKMFYLYSIPFYNGSEYEIRIKDFQMTSGILKNKLSIFIFYKKNMIKLNIKC